MRELAKILLIENDDATVKSIVTALERAGYSVQNAASGEEGLAMAKETPPSLIFLNLASPGTSGLEICKRIHGDEALKDVPLVLLTLREGKFDPLYTKLYGIVGFLTKPLDAGTLSDMVRKYIPYTEVIKSSAPSAARAHEDEAIEVGEEAVLAPEDFPSAVEDEEIEALELMDEAGADAKGFEASEGLEAETAEPPAATDGEGGQEVWSIDEDAEGVAEDVSSWAMKEDAPETPEENMPAAAESDDAWTSEPPSPQPEDLLGGEIDTGMAEDFVEHPSPDEGVEAPGWSIEKTAYEDTAVEAPATGASVSEKPKPLKEEKKKAVVKKQAWDGSGDRKGKSLENIFSESIQDKPGKTAPPPARLSAMKAGSAKPKSRSRKKALVLLLLLLIIAGLGGGASYMFLMKGVSPSGLIDEVVMASEKVAEKVIAMVAGNKAPAPSSSPPPSLPTPASPSEASLPEASNAENMLDSPVAMNIKPEEKTASSPSAAQMETVEKTPGPASDKPASKPLAKPEAKPPAAAPKASQAELDGYYVQFGIFKSEQNAKRLVRELKADGYRAIVHKDRFRSGASAYRVLLETKFDSEDKAGLKASEIGRKTGSKLYVFSEKG